jgi:hypothetical protein
LFFTSSIPCGEPAVPTTVIPDKKVTRQEEEEKGEITSDVKQNKTKKS